jgi:3-deoxy-D-manno-octulosonate 8-phosphate phosphatase (KDO 8-P phosphatase)
MRRRQAPPVAASRLARIALLVCDVDGVLTDGRVLLGEDGVERKLFSVIDGHGLVMLREAGVQVVLVTREPSGIAPARARKLGVPCYPGALDKGEVLRQLREQRTLAREQVAYVGDDLPDLDAFAEAGLRIAVADARPEVRRAADWVTHARGGQGAVREVCDRILAARRRTAGRQRQPRGS